MSLDLTLLEQAKVPLSHFARLCGMSRVTINLWRGERVAPRPLYRAVAVQRLGLIKRALEQGRLPLSRMKRSDKYAALLDALKSVQ
jgi:hypothetical protein